MGTNYYHRAGCCPTCGRADGEVHIGKSSAGWTFGFHGTAEIRSWQDWLTVLRSGGRIFDEYGEEVSIEEFQALVEAKAGEPLNHTTYCRASEDKWERRNGFECWLDDEGHSFDPGEFR